jgi:hypothetical protein
LIFFYIFQRITRGSTNGQEAPEERKENMYRKPHIDLHGIFQNKTGGEKLSKVVTLMSKGKRNKKEKEKRSKA